MNNQKQVFTLPMAIVLAAAIIGGVLLFIYHPALPGLAPAAARPASTVPGVPNTNALPPVTSSDHIFGNPNAPVKIVEYSDPSCPYCKVFQTTMLQVMQTYGASGQVAWIYREFPLNKPDANGNILHPNAGTQANAFECAASLGGNAAFWAYEKEWYATFPNDGGGETAAIDNGQLAAVAKTVKLDANKFADCVTTNRFASTVEKEYQGGVALGIQGTPTSYIVLPTGAPVMIEGAQPYSVVKAAIDAILQDQGLSTTTSAQ